MSLDSVYGSKRSFDAHLTHCGVHHDMSQRVSTMGKGTYPVRQGRRCLEVRTAKSNDTIARRAFVESYALRHSDPNVKVDLDRALHGHTVTTYRFDTLPRTKCPLTVVDRRDQQATSL